MSPESLTVPDFLPTSCSEPSGTLQELALELYRCVAASRGELEEQRKSAQQEIERHTREAGRTLARLAAVRFELERLLARIRPDLAEAGRGDLVRVLDLFARGWDAELARAGVEVRNPTGDLLTDELAAVIEVEGAIPDPTACQARVRETLSPLVLWAGRVIGTARVITSVPAPEAAGLEVALQPQEEP
jgi:hypothetical protein